MKLVLPALLFLLAFMVSCDPMRRINMVNKSSKDAEVVWVIKKDSVIKSPFFISNSDSVVFQLKNDKPYHIAKMSFGSGAWSSAQLDNLIDDLKGMEIHAASGNIRLDSAADIKSFLALRRTGLDKSKIKIVVK
jgi:hypothetical protein